MTEEKKGLKELNEIFDGLEVLAEFGGSVMADGKVGVDDVSSLVSLATKFNTLTDAASGMDEALLEAKDLDQAEVVIIVGRIYALVNKFAAAKK